MGLRIFIGGSRLSLAWRSASAFPRPRSSRGEIGSISSEVLEDSTFHWPPRWRRRPPRTTPSSSHQAFSRRQSGRARSRAREHHQAGPAIEIHEFPRFENSVVPPVAAVLLKPDEHTLGSSHQRSVSGDVHDGVSIGLLISSSFRGRPPV